MYFGLYDYRASRGQENAQTYKHALFDIDIFESKIKALVQAAIENKKTDILKDPLLFYMCACFSTNN